MELALKIHALDDVAVALAPIDRGAEIMGVRILNPIPPGHKFALHDIAEGSSIVKYGHPIGHSLRAIRAGEWVHTHNTATNLEGVLSYTYRPIKITPAQPFEGQFMGYLRGDGRVGVRNEIWIINMVCCVNKTSEKLAQWANERFRGRTGGIFAYTHPYGCSQIGDDLDRTRKLLAALARHPNAGGVLVLGLGCENNTMASFKELLGPVDERRIKFLVTQDVEDEYAEGLKLIEQIVCAIEDDARTEQPLSKLVIGLKCGGSDGLSGITANPLLGAFSDGLCAAGGSTLLTEVPEMFGAETILMNRCRDEQTYARTVDLINRYKQYFLSYGQAVSDNPSPGNKDGGLTTLEDKSLGCTQKGGTGPVCGVLDYAEPMRETGLHLVYAPGNDGCAITALTAAGAQIILFTTGRGTPMGAPVPTLKISTNSALAGRKPRWIDFDAGTLLAGLPMAEAAEELKELVLRTANGEYAKNEQNGYREIVIFKDGVTE